MAHASAAMSTSQILRRRTQTKSKYLGKYRHLQWFQEFEFPDHALTPVEFPSSSRALAQSKGMHKHGVSPLKYFDITDTCVCYVCVDSRRSMPIWACPRTSRNRLRGPSASVQKKKYACSRVPRSNPTLRQHDHHCLYHLRRK